MTDRLTVMGCLEGLTQDNWEQWYSDSEVQETAKAALALLKEQEPVEPKVIGTNSFGDPVHACGKCGILITESMNYCNGCGRKVKWNDLGIL